MKAFVVLNPVAGNNDRETVLDALKTHFSDAGIEYVVHETAKEEKPDEIVHTRLENEAFDFVVAAGGDGTVSQVVGGLIGSVIPLGIIPVGTGNLLARDLDIPLKIDEAVALIAGKNGLRKIDAMKVNGHISVLNASIGISAKVMKSTTSEIKNRFGMLAYIWKALGKLIKLKREFITVDIDGKTSKHHAIEVTIFNSGTIVKTLYPEGPDIRIDDGQLDVWIVSYKTIKDYPKYVFRLISKKTAKSLSHFMKANNRIMINSRVPMPLQVDGESIGTTPVEIEVLPGAINVIVRSNK
jgi:YegS/Rv2252/BmrU family lipid kinase